MQKDNPPTAPSKEDLREDYRNDPDGFTEKWGIPDEPAPTPSHLARHPSNDRLPGLDMRPVRAGPWPISRHRHHMA